LSGLCWNQHAVTNCNSSAYFRSLTMTLEKDGRKASENRLEAGWTPPTAANWRCEILFDSFCQLGYCCIVFCPPKCLHRTAISC
jgi:hypothetical protein